MCDGSGLGLAQLPRTIIAIGSRRELSSASPPEKAFPALVVQLGSRVGVIWNLRFGVCPQMKAAKVPRSDTKSFIPPKYEPLRILTSYPNINSEGLHLGGLPTTMTTMFVAMFF